MALNNWILKSMILCICLADDFSCFSQISLNGNLSFAPNITDHPYIDYRFGIIPSFGVQYDYGKHHSTMILGNYCWWKNSVDTFKSHTTLSYGLQYGFRFKIRDQHLKLAMGLYQTNSKIILDNPVLDYNFADKFHWKSLAFEFIAQYKLCKFLFVEIGYFLFSPTYILPDYSAGFAKCSIGYQLNFQK